MIGLCPNSSCSNVLCRVYTGLHRILALCAVHLKQRQDAFTMTLWPCTGMAFERVGLQQNAESKAANNEQPPSDHSFMMF